MGITFGDHLIDSGYYDITPEQEREIAAHECPTCKGSREIGWFDHAEGAWRNEPCNCYFPGDCDGSCTHPEPFPQPSRKNGGEPCGECHLQPNEICDICGAARNPETPKGEIPDATSK